MSSTEFSGQEVLSSLELTVWVAFLKFKVLAYASSSLVRQYKCTSRSQLDFQKS